MSGDTIGQDIFPVQQFDAEDFFGDGNWMFEGEDVDGNDGHENIQ